MLRKFDLHFVLLLALSAFAWLPLVTPGYFMGAHDAPHSLFFLQAFDEVIRDGFWWPAWGPNFAFGYGYPLWIFYAPLTYYLGEVFHLLGADLTTAMKLVDLVATLGATVSIYLWARNHFSRQAAAFAALVYTYTPYHLLDLYVRSAVAEYFTFVWFPLILWRWELLLQTPNRRHAILAALVTAALVLTHHGAAFIFAALLAAYLLFTFARGWIQDGRLALCPPKAGAAKPRASSRAPRSGAGEARARDMGEQTADRRQPSIVCRLGYASIAGVLALGLSAIFWLPMLLEQRYIVVEQWTSVAYNYEKHFVFLNQFFSPFWGFGYSGEWLNDGMAFQLGLMPIVCAVVALLFGLQQGRWRSHTLFFLTASGVTLLLMSPSSAPFWRAVPIAALVQFPWRLLALSTIALAWLAGAALEAIEYPISNIHHLSRYWILDINPSAALLMLVVVLASFNYTLPQYTARSVRGESARAAVDFELVSYTDRTGYMTWASAQPQTSPLVAEYRAGAPLTKAIALTPGAQIELLHHGGQSERVRVRSSNEAEIQFRIYYFPGWRASVDGQPVSIWPSGPQALITLAVPAGDHIVDLRFEDTSVRALAKVISLLSVLLIGGWTFFSTRGARRRTKFFAPRVGLLLVMLLAGCGGSNGTTSAVTPLATTAFPAQSSSTSAAATQPTASNSTALMSTATATIIATPPSAPPSQQSPTTQYVVQPNDTLGAIAQKFGTTVDAILKANNLSDPRLLRAGQTIVIPLPTLTPTPTATATPDATQRALPPTPTPIVYVVQPGDVLSLIAAKYNLPVDEIMVANGLKDTFIRAGQSLVIPAPTPTPTVTSTPLPTSTPTAALAFGEPMLLYPPDGASFSSSDSIVLNWTAVGALSDDQYYVLRLRALDSARSESVWLKTPSYRLPETWRGAKIEWDVIVLQVTKTNADGTREGKIQSPFSKARTFTWR